MSDLTSKTFWSETAERAVKSAGQALVIALGGNALSAFDLDWLDILGVVLAAALLSVATSLASITVGPKGSPSLVPETPTEQDDDEGDATPVVESAAGPIVPLAAPKKAPRQPRARANKATAKKKTNAADR